MYLLAKTSLLLNPDFFFQILASYQCQISLLIFDPLPPFPLSTIFVALTNHKLSLLSHITLSLFHLPQYSLFFNQI